MKITADAEGGSFGTSQPKRGSVSGQEGDLHYALNVQSIFCLRTRR